MPVCTKCKLELSLEQFHKRSKVPCGHDSWCKPCKTLYRRDYFLRNKEKEQTRSREKAWKGMGIDFTESQYHTLFQEQAGTCAICNRQVNSRLHVDHCHTTGRVRGLLCGNCNKAIGLLEDNIQYIQNAVSYLEKSND